MSDKTAIQWTDHTWNPWRGCTRISAGCKNCYMFTEQARYGQDPATVTRTKTWKDPHRLQRMAKYENVNKMVFTCSWSDWFHEDADQWRGEAWRVIQQCPNLIFQILTKRPERIAQHLPGDWGDGYKNVWLGTSVENQAMADLRIPQLLATPAKILFLSVEPMLEAIDFEMATEEFQPLNPDLSRKPFPIQWIIFGGESGHGARPCNIEWIRDGVRQCQSASVPCFVKQLGSNVVDDTDEYSQWRLWDKSAFSDRKGGVPSEWPKDLRVRQFPEVKINENI